MNITMNIDCSPEEARRLMGLPDLAPIHDLYLDKMRDVINAGGMTPDMVEQMLGQWGPMGEMGMNAWRQMLGQVSGQVSGKSGT